MTLPVILNAVLAVAILGVMIAPHLKAIAAEHRRHQEPAALWRPRS